MSCEDKIKMRCKKSPASCINYEAEIPEFSSIFGDECTSIEEVAEDQYFLIGEIKSEIDLTNLDEGCLELPTDNNTKKMFQYLIDTICGQAQQIQALLSVQETQAQQITALQNQQCP